MSNFIVSIKKSLTISIVKSKKVIILEIIFYLKGHCCLDELMMKPRVTMLLKSLPWYI